MNTPNEYCPFCDARVISRERRPIAYAVCENGHTFPTTAAALDPTPPAKTPAELHAEWERIAADLGDGIATAVERAEADAAANAVKTEREAIAAWLEWFGRETAFPGSFHALAVAVKQGDYPRDLPGREEREERLREEGRREEREATAAWLRRGDWASGLNAEKIERGEHRREEEDK